MLASFVAAVLFFGTNIADAAQRGHSKLTGAHFHLALQIALDRSRFSPGPIDGKMGANTEKALKVFQRAYGLAETGRPGKAVWEKLAGVLLDPALIGYTISTEDTAGPFASEIPNTLVEQSKLDHLGYTSPAELLAEKFHMDIDLLTRLNPHAPFDQPGTSIRVASVARGNRPVASRLQVDKQSGGVLVFDRSDTIVAFFPATIGSQETPSPSGRVKVTDITKNPTYTYDPEKLDFKGVETTQKLEIKPGPNNPVGLVWVGLSEPGYGIHGSPEPARISRQQSHGCVRLTNWDALDLAQMVRRGTPVRFTDHREALNETFRH